MNIGRTFGVKFRISILLSALALAVFAGRTMADEPQGHIDLTKLDAAMNAKIEKIFARPSVDKAMDKFVEELFAEPDLQKRGATLMQTLGADTKISESVQAIMKKIGESQAMLNLVKDLMQQNPDKSPEEIGKLVAARYGKAFESPEVHKAFESSFQALIGKLEVNWQQSAIVAELTKRFNKQFSDPARFEKWEKRLTELNGGKTPGVQEAVDLYVSHAWSEERTEKFLTSLLANAKARQEMAKMLDEMLAIESVGDEIRRGAAEIAADSDVQDSIGKAMDLILAPKIDGKEIQAQMIRLLAGPNVVKSMNGIAKVILSSDQVREIAIKHIDALAEDEELAKMCQDFLDNW